MAFDWDEILVSKDPDNKEVSVNFTAVDGTPYPGSPASELCVRVYSNETFTHITGSAHWVWLELTAAPDRYVKVRLDFDSGNGIGEPTPSPQYAEFYPGDDRTLQFSLSAGVADDLLNSSNYRATASIAGSSCAVSQATVEFVRDATEPDPDPDEETGGDGDPIESDPKPECEPHDCDAVASLLSEKPEYADGLWFLTPAEFTAKTPTNPNNGLIGHNKTAYDPVPVPLSTFPVDPITIGQALGTGPCYTDRNSAQVPTDGANFRITPVTQVPFWTATPWAGSFTVDYSAVLYCAPNTVQSFGLTSFQVPSVYTSNSLAGPIWTVGAEGVIDRINNTLTVDLQWLGFSRTRALSDIEAATGVLDLTFSCTFTYYVLSAPNDEFGNPQINPIKESDLYYTIGDSGINGEFIDSTLQLKQGDNLQHDPSGGLYPNVLIDAKVLWIGANDPLESKEDKQKRVNEIRDALRRSWQEYTPPTYCERIP